MCISNSQLDEHILKRDLIAVSRQSLESNKLQGFPLAYSPDLLLVRYVYDFHLDGLLLIRRKDISYVHCRETDRFQRKLLETENRIKRGLFRRDYSVESFTSFLQRINHKQIVVRENETPGVDDFFIGRHINSDKDTVTIHEFSGAGNWERDMTKIPIDTITCCQIETNYINFYSRHFDRTSQ